MCSSLQKDAFQKEHLLFIWMWRRLFFFFFILRGGFNWSLLGSLSLARFCSPLCSGGREMPKDQSKVNVDCVCFNLSILRKKKKKENLTQQSNLFLRRQPTVVFSPLSPSLPLFFKNESLTHFTCYSGLRKTRSLSGDDPASYASREILHEWTHGELVHAEVRPETLRHDALVK